MASHYRCNMLLLPYWQAYTFYCLSMGTLIMHCFSLSFGDFLAKCYWLGKNARKATVLCWLYMLKLLLVDYLTLN